MLFDEFCLFFCRLVQPSQRQNGRLRAGKAFKTTGVLPCHSKKPNGEPVAVRFSCIYPLSCPFSSSICPVGGCLALFLLAFHFSSVILQLLPQLQPLEQDPGIEENQDRGDGNGKQHTY